MPVNKVVYGSNTLIDLTSDDVTAEKLITGTKAHDKSGSPITGTNPYEKAATDAEVNAQADLIAQIATALEGKASGGDSGGNVATCTVTIDGTSYCCIQGVVATVVSDGVVENVYLSEGTEGYTGYPVPLVINNVVCDSYLCVKTASTNRLAVHNGEDETNMSVVEVFRKLPTQNNSSSHSCDDLLHVLKAPSAAGASGSVKINYVYGK